MLLKAHGVLLSFKILGKLPPSGVNESKERILEALPKLAKLSEDKECDFTDKYLPQAIAETFSRLKRDDLAIVA